MVVAAVLVLPTTTAPAVAMAAMEPMVATPMAAPETAVLVAVAFMAMAGTLLATRTQVVEPMSMAERAAAVAALVAVAPAPLEKAAAVATLVAVAVPGLVPGVGLTVAVVAPTMMVQTRATAMVAILVMAMW